MNFIKINEKVFNYYYYALGFVFLVFLFNIFKMSIKEVLIDYFKLTLITKDKINDRDFSISLKSIKLKLNENNKKIWKNVVDKFSTNYKKESSRLVKKNGLSEEYKIEYVHPSIENIYDIKHKINILNIFQESILNINNKLKTEGKDIIEDKDNPIPYLIAASKIIQYYMTTYLALKSLKSLLNYFKNIIIAIFLTSAFFYIVGSIVDTAPKSNDFIVLVQHYHLLIFVLGFFFFSLIVPLSYIFFTLFKINSLKIHRESKHDNWSVFFKNIAYSNFTFFTSLLLIFVSITLLSSSGLEYNKTFHFLSNLLLPTLELQDIPKFFVNLFGNDLIFGIFLVKILFLVFVFYLSILFIQQFIEKYMERFDTENSKRYSIPPEFAKFFSYLMLSIFAIILLYGTLFINYPNLAEEYKVCKSYLRENYRTQKNCRTVKDSNNTTDMIYKYCHNLSKLGESNISYCPAAMSIESDKQLFRTNEAITSPNRSLSDYLPLSIFLALFGTVMMLATKNLLENYFSGLSLKINSPYEEGERVRIDGGEMLSVESIGFRATTFYGISSNAHLVIPNYTLTNTIITNYTQPTLDYRKTITIHIPDQKHIDMNIPREAEKIMLLAAFIATGVKKPKLDIDDIEVINDEKKIYVEQTETPENQTKIDNNWKKIVGENTDNNMIEEKRKKLFLNAIVELVELIDKDPNPKYKEIKIIKTLISSILSVLADYKKDRSFNYYKDEYLVKRKFDSFNYKDKSPIEIKTELNKLSEYLVNVSYYYFALTKQLWSLKTKDISKQRQNDFDHASLEVLDVPRVTSKHKRDVEGAFWDVSLMVTVELGEQSDEIIHHINIFIDELWDIFDLPSRCRLDDENKVSRRDQNDRLLKSKKMSINPENSGVKYQ